MIAPAGDCSALKINIEWSSYDLSINGETKWCLF